MICSPIGSPAVLHPHGTEMPGSPARLTGTVEMSCKYICSGFSISPMRYAVVGAVGVMITSTFSKARVKSSRISVRTFSAFR